MKENEKVTINDTYSSWQKVLIGVSYDFVLDLLLICLTVTYFCLRFYYDDDIMVMTLHSIQLKRALECIK